LSNCAAVLLSLSEIAPEGRYRGILRIDWPRFQPLRTDSPWYWPTRPIQGPQVSPFEIEKLIETVKTRHVLCTSRQIFLDSARDRDDDVITLKSALCTANSEARRSLAAIPLSPSAQRQRCQAFLL
jgi:hypothetical protein